MNYNKYKLNVADIKIGDLWKVNSLHQYIDIGYYIYNEFHKGILYKLNESAIIIILKISSENEIIFYSFEDNKIYGSDIEYFAFKKL